MILLSKKCPDTCILRFFYNIYTFTFLVELMENEGYIQNVYKVLDRLNFWKYF